MASKAKKRPVKRARARPRVPSSVMTLLLDIYERLGSVESKQEQIISEQTRANDGRSKIYQSQAAMVRRLDPLDGGVEPGTGEPGGLIKKIAGIEVEVKKATALRLQLGLIVGAIATVSSAAGWLLWYVLTHPHEIAGAFRALFGAK